MEKATFEIHFRDLTGDAQRRLCETFRTSPSEENWDVFPVTVIERYTEPCSSDLHKRSS